MCRTEGTQRRPPPRSSNPRPPVTRSCRVTMCVTHSYNAQDANPLLPAGGQGHRALIRQGARAAEGGAALTASGPSRAASWSGEPLSSPPHSAPPAARAARRSTNGRRPACSCATPRQSAFEKQHKRGGRCARQSPRQRTGSSGSRSSSAGHFITSTSAGPASSSSGLKASLTHEAGWSGGPLVARATPPCWSTSSSSMAGVAAGPSPPEISTPTARHDQISCT